MAAAIDLHRVARKLMHLRVNVELAGAHTRSAHPWTILSLGIYYSSQVRSFLDLGMVFQCDLLAEVDSDDVKDSFVIYRLTNYI